MTIFCLFLAILLSPALGAADQGRYLALLERMERSYAQVHDYTAVFHRRERVRGKQLPEEAIFLKFQKPFKVYLRWLSGPRRGREILYVKGKFHDQALVHEASGLAQFFSFLINPAGERVLSESRYPLNDIGFGRLIEVLAAEMRRAGVGREIRLKERGEGEISGRPVQWLESFLVRSRTLEDSPYRIVLGIDVELSLPIQATVFDSGDTLLGEYRYSEIRLNIGLAEEDFDPSNPDYNFSSWRISLSN